MKIRRLRRPEVTREQAIALVKAFDRDLVMDYINDNQDPVVARVFFYGLGMQGDVNIVLNKDMTWEFAEDE